MVHERIGEAMGTQVVDRRLESQIEQAVETEVGQGRRMAADVIDRVSGKFGVYRQDVRFAMNVLELQVDSNGLIVVDSDRGDH